MTLTGLQEALNLIDVAILMLDPDMRVRFANARFVELLALPTVIMPSDMTFRQVLSHGASLGRYPMPAANLLAYLDEREAAVRAGPVPPTVMRLSGARDLRFRCIVCPDGGRILTYTDIAQELRHEAADAEHRFAIEQRFKTETMDAQAELLASLAEAAAEHAQQAEAARSLLEHEVAERRQLEVKLRLLATTDGLTGALSRTEFLALGQREVELWRQSGEDLVVLMLDVDHFKAINDRYGHAGGDGALKHLVDLLRAGIRWLDLLGRLGGEEFAIILPGTSQAAGECAAERLRAVVAEIAAPNGEAPIAMTISIGLAVQRASDQSIEQIIARADSALYQAKRAGRKPSGCRAGANANRSLNSGLADEADAARLLPWRAFSAPGPDLSAPVQAGAKTQRPGAGFTLPGAQRRRTPSTARR